MPTYEYACTACGNEFERFERITAKPDPTCPKCNKKKAQRRISGGAGLLFKGSGFYVTDYKRGNGGKEGPKESKPAVSTSCCGGGACAHSAKAAAKN